MRHILYFACGLRMGNTFVCPIRAHCTKPKICSPKIKKKVVVLFSDSKAAS